MRLRSALFSVLVCVFLCGPALLFGALRLGADVPVQLTAEPAQFLAGGAKSADVAAAASGEGFRSKQLQSAVETEIGNYIPAKATAIEMNAGVQRGFIAASDVLFGWGCYPTYFGSGRITVPSADAVTYLPRKYGDWARRDWEGFAAGLASVASRYPEKRFVVYVVGAYDDPSCNPAYALVTDPLRPENCVAIMEEALSGSSNVTVLSHSYGSEEEYYQDFFRTDHHWNIDGAFAAYGQIADELGLEAIPEQGIWEIPDYWYTGATARWGLDMLRERVFDCGNSFAELVVMRSDGSVLHGDDHAAFWDAPELKKPYTFYDSYYDNLGECVIAGGDGERSALLVSNSYKGAIQRPLASSYRQLTVTGQLHSATPLTLTLAEQIEAADADDIIIVGNPGALRIGQQYWE